jgi:hypothetical protein
MKKILIALLNVLLMLSVFVGCKDKNETAKPDNTPSNSEDTNENSNENNETNSLPEMPWAGDPIELPTDEWE